MNSQNEQIKQFLQAAFTRRRLFLVVAATVALFIVAGTFFVPKVYEAKSTVFIERNVLNSLMQGITINPSMNDRIRVLRYSMLSRDVVTRTLKKMDMDAREQYADAASFEALVQKCQEKTLINVRGSDLFFVSIVDPDPYFAKEYINTLVNIYVEENMAGRREESYGANRFLAEQVAFYKGELDEIESNILDFRKKTGIYSNVNEVVVMDKIAKDEEELKRLRSQKNVIASTIKTIKMQLEAMQGAKDLGFSDSFDDIFGDTGGEDYRVEQLQAKVDELLLFYNDQYPTVVKLREQIEELKKRQEDNPPAPAPVVEVSDYNPVDDPIYVDLKMRMNSAQSDLNALASKEKDLLAGIEANQSLLRDFPQDKKTLNNMERERVSRLEVYDKLLQRVGISEVSKQMEVSDKSTTFRIVDPAILPTAPVGTKRISLMLLGVIAGLAAGFGAVFVLEMLDDSIKGPQSFRELGVTVLAEIPFIWSEVENQLVRKKDVAAVVFASLCAVMVGFMFMHDLLGFSFIDRILSNLGVNNFQL